MTSPSGRGAASSARSTSPRPRRPHGRPAPLRQRDPDAAGLVRHAGDRCRRDGGRAPRLFSAVAGVEGRKVLFLLTERFTPTPGRDVWDYVAVRAHALRLHGRCPRGRRRGGGSPDLNDFTYKDFDRSPCFRDSRRARTQPASRSSRSTRRASRRTKCCRRRAARTSGGSDEGILQARHAVGASASSRRRRAARRSRAATTSRSR